MLQPGEPRTGEQAGRERIKGYAIDLERIRPDPTQPRRVLHDEALKELAASIRRLGIVQAISVRYIPSDDIYQIISGERRYQAAKLAGLPAIPCIVDDPADGEVLVRQVVENWHRSALHPFEIADALGQLRDTRGFSQKKIAEETGKSESDVSMFLKLLELTPAVQKEARNDPTAVLSFKHLYQIARLAPDDQVAIADAARHQRLSAADTAVLVRRTIQKRTAAPKRGAPVTRVQYVTTKARVIITFRKQAVTNEEILAALDEARDKAAPTKQRLNIERRK